MQASHKISFIGAGNMSKAIISGMVAKGYPAENIMASNPSAPKLETLHEKLGIHTTFDNQQAIEFADIVILSVKPQMMKDVCKAFDLSKVNANKLFVSIAAGLPINKLSQYLSGLDKIVRVMPNTPSAIGMGMSGIYANSSVSTSEVTVVADIMSSVGKTLIVDNEDDINTVIAAAGSSPAYFFLVAEAMQKAAVDMGLKPSDARLLVVQAMRGSATLMQDEDDLELSELRAQVTSKGGTTHEAVTSLQASGIEAIFAKAMQAAVTRAKEMSEQI